MLATRAGHREPVLERLAAAAARRPDVAARAFAPLAPLAPDVAARPLTPLVPAVAPVMLGDGRAVQVDGTTCGSAVLSMLAMAGDPVLAWWVWTGVDPVPPAGGRPGRPAAAHADDRHGAVGRFDLLQRAAKAATNRSGLGPLPWPAAFGTPPWGAARVARFAGYGHRVVDDRSEAGARVVRAALLAASRGVPVPLFAGGDLRTGWSDAVPRHVVLLAAAAGE